MNIERGEEELEICPLCGLSKKLYPYGKGKLCHECIMSINWFKRREEN